MRACTKKERLAATSENINSAKERTERIQKKMAQVEGKTWRDILKEREEKLNKEESASN